MVTSTTKDFAVDAAVEKLGVSIDTGITHDGSDIPARVSTDADRKVTLYSTTTGEPHEILLNDAPRVLRKRRRDGSRAFWAEEMPGERPLRVVGTVQCMLHPDFDETDGAAGFDRKFIDDIGLAGRTCNMMAPDKANRGDFKSVYERDDHMAKKHRREWRTIEAAQEQADAARDRAERRETTDAMLALAGRAAGAPVAPAPEPEEVTQSICDVQGCDMECSTERYLGVHKAKALDEAHRRARGEEA